LNNAGGSPYERMRMWVVLWYGPVVAVVVDFDNRVAEGPSHALMTGLQNLGVLVFKQDKADSYSLVLAEECANGRVPLLPLSSDCADLLAAVEPSK